MKINIFFLLIMALSLSSCASIFTGSKKKVTFDSTPQGATVYVNGYEKGITPCNIKVEAEDRIDFKLENYTEKVIVMDSKFNLIAILNGFNIIGWGVDHLTGSLKRVKGKNFKVTLEKDDKTAFFNYMKKGDLTKINIDSDKKVIESIVVLRKDVTENNE